MARPYYDTFIEAFDLIWGEGFISPGGPAAVHRIINGIDLSGMLALDFGCALGGIDCLLARHFGCRVIGVDIEAALVAEGQRRVAELGLTDQVELRLVDPGPLPFAASTFDLVFSKESLLFIDDKPALLGSFFRMLKPGGWLAFSDWLGRNSQSEDSDTDPILRRLFEVRGAAYHLATADVYRGILADCGFHETNIVDVTDQIMDEQSDAVRRIGETQRDQLLTLVGEAEADHMLAFNQCVADAMQAGALRAVVVQSRVPSRRQD